MFELRFEIPCLDSFGICKLQGNFVGHSLLLKICLIYTLVWELNMLSSCGPAPEMCSLDLPPAVDDVQQSHILMKHPLLQTVRETLDTSCTLLESLQCL